MSFDENAETFNKVRFYLEHYVECCREIIKRVNDNDGSDVIINKYNKLESLSLPFHPSMLLNKRYSSLRNSKQGIHYLKTNSEDELYNSNFNNLIIYCDDECDDLFLFLECYKYWNFKSFSSKFINLLINSPKGSVRKFYNKCSHDEQKEMLWMVDTNETEINFICYIAAYYNRIDLFKYLKDREFPLYTGIWEFILKFCDSNTVDWCAKNIKYKNRENAFILAASNHHKGIFDIIIRNIKSFNGPYPYIIPDSYGKETGINQLEDIAKYPEKYPIDFSKKIKYTSVKVADMYVKLGFAYNESILDRAIFAGRLDIVKSIIQQPINFDPSRCEIAALSGNIEMLKFLLGLGYALGVDILTYVAFSGNFDMIKMIIGYAKEHKLEYVKPTIETIKVCEQKGFDHIKEFLKNFEVVPNTFTNFTMLYEGLDIPENNITHDINMKLSYGPIGYNYLYKNDINISISPLDRNKMVVDPSEEEIERDYENNGYHFKIDESIGKNNFEEFKTLHQRGQMWSNDSIVGFSSSSNVSDFHFSKFLKYMLDYGANFEPYWEYIRSNFIHSEKYICLGILVKNGLKIRDDMYKILIDNEIILSTPKNKINHSSISGFNQMGQEPLYESFGFPVGFPAANYYGFPVPTNSDGFPVPTNYYGFPVPTSPVGFPAANSDGFPVPRAPSEFAAEKKFDQKTIEMNNNLTLKNLRDLKSLIIEYDAIIKSKTYNLSSEEIESIRYEISTNNKNYKIKAYDFSTDKIVEVKEDNKNLWFVGINIHKFFKSYVEFIEFTSISTPCFLVLCDNFIVEDFSMFLEFIRDRIRNSNPRLEYDCPLRSNTYNKRIQQGMHKKDLYEPPGVDGTYQSISPSNNIFSFSPFAFPGAGFIPNQSQMTYDYSSMPPNPTFPSNPFHQNPSFSLVNILPINKENATIPDIIPDYPLDFSKLSDSMRFHGSYVGKDEIYCYNFDTQSIDKFSTEKEIWYVGLLNTLPYKLFFSKDYNEMKNNGINAPFLIKSNHSNDTMSFRQNYLRQLTNIKEALIAINNYLESRQGLLNFVNERQNGSKRDH